MIAYDSSRTEQSWVRHIILPNRLNYSGYPVILSCVNRRVAVRAIVVHNGKLLCAKAKPYGPTVNTMIWVAPGGGIKAGEALVPALEREIVEELGIRPI